MKTSFRTKIQWLRCQKTTHVRPQYKPSPVCSSLQQRVSVARKVAIPLNNTDTVGFTLSNSRQNGTEKSGIVA